MNLKLAILLLLVAAGVAATPNLLKLRSKRDLLVFSFIWGIAVAGVLNDLAEGPELRPLDWVRAAMAPLGFLNP
ncbi:hypothetical protein [uncultured Paenibacillus sp.]|uniref:hypothetical protein n=1 Tax=uncultured Paenibacillus sp. TaxID=227322 RepID=UPI0015AFD921|nr:hypothetical protein [uncultured Paenibacillus sp.]